MKKITTFLFALLCVAAGAFAQTTFEVGGVNYAVTGSNTVEVVENYNTPYSGGITIPASVPNNGSTYSVTAIGENAFADCTELTSITMPNSVITIGDGAFSSCTGLTSITIPGSVTTIGDFAFVFCSALTSIQVEVGSATYSSAGGVLYNKNQTTLVQYPAGKIGSFTIPSSVQTVGTAAFAGCIGITSVTIPSSVKTVGLAAFAVCFRLTSIQVNGGNTAYSSTNGVLYDKDQTILVQYPAGKTGSFTIPGSVKTVGATAFAGCISVTSVTIPNSVTSIGENAFSTTGLTSVTIPNSVTTIGEDAFAGCGGLTSVTISNSLTAIAAYTFQGCTGLTSVTIPSSVRTIGAGAFSDCTGLTSITSLNPMPPALDLSAFNDYHYTTCMLYVPSESHGTYKNHSEWGRFNTISAVATSLPTASTSTAKVYALAGTLYVEGAEQPYAVYSLTGAQLYTGTAPSITLPHGTYVVTIGNERRKVVVQ